MAVAADTLDAPTPQAGERAVLGHPIGLSYLASMEAFERFSFYGMQALLVLYMTSQLLHRGHVEHVAGFAAFRAGLERVFGPMRPQQVASEVFGLYAGLCSLTPVFGGLAGDQWLGQKRAVLLGGAMMAAGHFLMAFEGPFLLALVLLIVGCGLLKGNISAQVGALYAGADRRRTDAFQLFYMAANVGVFTAPLVCGTLGETVGWHWGFGAAGVGMLISLAIYLAGYRRMPPDTLPKRGERRPEQARLTAADLPVLAAMGVILVVVALFWIANGEVLNAYMIWARAHLDRQIGGFTLPVTWLQSASAIVGICLAPVLVGLWSGQAKRGREPSALGKMTTGCGLAAAAYGLLALACAVSGAGQVPLAWALAFHLVVQSAYLFVYPVGMALFSRVAPPAINALMIGVYFLSVFAGSLLVGWVGQFYERMTAPGFWLLHSAAAGGAGLILLILWGPLSRAFMVKPI
ncbi:peptide MFS transporter [Phenylobacterium sp.]|jgi:POT family proton-dependent oligopeptide transporter|uniref:peptide MFS transporter n=1 Tax=Phenylobacterium sp. TaxID=1871053 RepID=UPI002F4148F6